MKDRKLLGSEMGRILPDEYAAAGDSGLVAVLDNVRSSHNVGSVFRSCDAFRIDRLYLCGICDTPPSARLHKTALGAEMSVPWERCDDTLQLVRRLHADGYVVVAVEQTVNAVPLNDFRAVKGEKYAFIFGNEVEGVAQDVVDEADFAVEIPQWGSKHSLNVSVAAGIVLYQAHLSLNI